MAGMTAPPRLELALLPTPILKLERLSRRLGVELYVKRDDLTGLLEAGGEVRKLEFLAAEALSRGADTLITRAAPQSNACRAVAAVAARLGCRAVIAVEAPRPTSCDGNLLLARVLGAEVHYLNDPESGNTGLDDLAAVLRAEGRRPYLVPEGGADEIGALGYLEAAVELTEQINHGAPRFDTVVIAAESGTSQAGLLMGKSLAGLPSEIVGVPVTDSADVVRGRITGIIRTAIRRFGFAIDVPKGIHLLDGYQGRAGGAVDEDDLRAVVDLAQGEGLLLDPGVTIRAFRGLLDTLGRDAKALGSRVCFVHAGAPFSLFPLRERLTGLLDGTAHRA
jgi:1-aminocyclopropane-1-carboxylate deaminase/D-cysteine desulfhydrase-like pyridoxal-dependent ACC family enzyme